MVVIRVALACDMGSGDMFDKNESTRTIDIFLVPFVTVRIQVLFAVDKIERHPSAGDESTRRKMQREHNGVVIGDLNRFDHLEHRLAVAGDAFGRKDDLVERCLDVVRVQWRAIMELEALSNLEGVLGPTFGATGYVAFANITLKVSGVPRIVRVDPKQQTVERTDRVDHAECRLDMAVIGRDLAAHHEVQNTSLFRGGNRDCYCTQSKRYTDNGSDALLK